LTIIDSHILFLINKKIKYILTPKIVGEIEIHFYFRLYIFWSLNF